MLECLILGDSIAVGLQQTTKQCAIYAKSGINTQQFNKQFSGEFFSNVVIISLGANDHKNIMTGKELEDLRRRITAKNRVVWILPAGNSKTSGVDIQSIVDTIMNIASANNDMVVSPHPKYMSRDGIHPTGTGYRWLNSFITGTTGIPQK